MGGEEEGVVCTRATSGLLQFSIRRPLLEPRSKQLKFSLMSSSEIIQNSELQVYERALYKVGYVVLRASRAGVFCCVKLGWWERGCDHAEGHSDNLSWWSLQSLSFQYQWLEPAVFLSDG